VVIPFNRPAWGIAVISLMVAGEVGEERSTDQTEKLLRVVALPAIT